LTKAEVENGQAYPELAVLAEIVVYILMEKRELIRKRAADTFPFVRQGHQELGLSILIFHALKLQEFYHGPTENFLARLEEESTKQEVQLAKIVKHAQQEEQALDDALKHHRPPPRWTCSGGGGTAPAV